MAKVVFGMAVSLDGYVNDENGSVSRLYPDLAALRDEVVLQEAIAETGAVVMGRHTYEMGSDYTGYEYQVPIFVVTHHPPAAPAKGENDGLKFHFVTEGVESAIEQAKAAAGDKTVSIVGGVNVMAQAIKAGLLDELDLGIMPVVLGGGLNLFEYLGSKSIELERLRVLESSGGRVDVRYRVVNNGA